MSYIKVSYEVCSTPWHTKKMLQKLKQYDRLGFDTETQGVYTKAQRKEATKLLKEENVRPDHRKLALLVANNSGLSFPSLVRVTHFIFGISESESVILITQHPQEEFMIWNWIAEYKGLLLIHNTLFDLKLMYHRIGKFPEFYEDTQLLAKCLINNADVWKAKVGLKDLMGSYYNPKWTLMEDYEPTNLKDPDFLDYAGIDGGAVVKLYENLEEHCNE